MPEASFSPMKSTNPNEITRLLGSELYTLNPSLVVLGDPTTSLFSRWTLKVKKMFFSAVAISFMGLLTPVAMLLPNLHTRFVAKVIPAMMEDLAHGLRHERSTLLKNVQGKVLDVGAGGGAYFKHYSSATSVVAIEPMTQLHPHLKSKGLELGINDRLILTTSFIETFLQEHPDEAGTFDWVILGNVLCEVPDIASALQTCDKLLRPGSGTLYFCEHIAQPPGSIMRTIQMVINPWWVRISKGCNCNRESFKYIKAMRGWESISWTYNMVGGHPWVGPFVIGLARKK